jgi:two-component system, cell cycle sensor histidine kinase and response regulator CckA
LLVGAAMLDYPRTIAFTADLTERKRAEAAAISEQTRFRALVDNSADGIVLSTATGEFVYVSPAAERMLGRTAADVIGTNFRTYLHPDDVQEAVDHRRRLFEVRGYAPPAVRRIVRPDGAIRWVEVTATNLLDNPAVGAVVNNVRDITERRLAEDALVVANQRFTALFESGIIGIVIADTSGAVQQANETFLGMLGYTREALDAGRLDWQKSTPPEWVEWDEGTADELRRHGRATAREHEYVRKDGTRVPVLVGAAAVEGGQLISFSVDLTERERAAEAMANLEAQFRQAQKMEAVGVLAGGVAHDFNNVLSVILCYGEMLLAEMKPGDPMRADVEEIREAGKRAAALTRQLLMFSRQQVFEPKVVDLNEVIAGMEKMVRRLVGEDVDLVTTLAVSLGKVRADAGSIEQVIMNLVVNARDAMPVGGKLTIETANVILDEAYAGEHLGVKPGPHVLVAVSDTGTGMDRAT